jgi:hypothetical protein
LAKIGRHTLLEVHLELAIITVLLAGLNDKDGLVVSTVEKVIGDWFSRVPNRSMLKAIQQFDLEKKIWNSPALIWTIPLPELFARERLPTRVYIRG